MLENKEKYYDYAKHIKVFIAIPCIIVVITLAVLAVLGPEVSIDFKGGTIITYSYTGEISLNDVENVVEENNFGSVKVSSGTAFGSDLQILTLEFASSEGLNEEQLEGVTNFLISSYTDNSLKHEGSRDVSPSSGYKFFLKCLVAVLLSFIIIVVYIAIRFKNIGGWSSGMFALIALMCDVFMVVATFVFLRFPIDSNFIAAALTILGYSINNTIVVYDRIRENKTLYGAKASNREIVNMSIKQSITRAVNTTLAVVAAVAAVCVVAVACGVNSILSFAFPMLVGVCSGVFSTLCLAGPLWVVWDERKTKKRKAKTA